MMWASPTRHPGKDLGFDSGFAQGFASGESRSKARMTCGLRPPTLKVIFDKTKKSELE
jgi:hypothetical protein